MCSSANEEFKTPKIKSMRERSRNLFVVNGLIKDILFEDAFGDVLISGHVFGDFVKTSLAKCSELSRTTALCFSFQRNVTLLTIYTGL